jgi:hypothetical protein
MAIMRGASFRLLAHFSLPSGRDGGRDAFGASYDHCGVLLHLWGVLGRRCILFGRRHLLGIHLLKRLVVLYNFWEGVGRFLNTSSLTFQGI